MVQNIEPRMMALSSAFMVGICEVESIGLDEMEVEIWKVGLEIDCCPWEISWMGRNEQSAENGD